MKERGLHEIYESDPERADAQLWGRKASTLTRRGFLRGSGLAAVSLALGAKIPFARFAPSGWIPVVFAASSESFVLKGKDGLRVINDRPLNAETPPHLLDDEVTPIKRLFVRNNGLIPDLAKNADTTNWTLTIDGEVHKPVTLSYEDLTTKFDQVSHQMVLECAGNGRAGYYPPTRGNQWTYGAVGCPVWTGVRLRDILKVTRLKRSAVYTAYYGHDVHISGDRDKVVISRGTPIKKAADPHTLIALKINDQRLPAAHGFPARLICPGFPGSVSGKWLKKITIRDQIHDGPQMGGYSYRVPKHPVKAGAKVRKDDMKIIEEMPVKSLITSPKSGEKVHFVQREKFPCRGFAWSAGKAVKAVHVTADFGQTWTKARLASPINRYAWQRWVAEVKLPTRGYYEIFARATDEKGRMQPMVVPGWNPKGYLNNAMPRIAVTVV